jgi:hypothetical protein
MIRSPLPNAHLRTAFIWEIPNKMIRKICALTAMVTLSAILLSACTLYAPEGDGTLSNGDPIFFRSSFNTSTDQFKHVIVGPTGWKCTGRHGHTDQDVLTIPLKCSNGATGVLVLKYDKEQDELTRGSFKLSNGTTGQLKYRPHYLS